ATGLAIAREVGNRRTEGAVLEALGAVEHEHGSAELALARYEEALALHRSVGNRRAQGTVLVRLAELHLLAGRLDEARAACAQGEAQMRAIDDRLDLVELLCVRVRLELACGDRAAAQASLDDATRGAEALRLDPQSRLWSDLAALRAALARSDATAR
nr:hypothetical protein [Caldimonas sp.]